MWTSKSLSDLRAPVRDRMYPFVADIENAIPGLKMIVSCTIRDKEAQDALYKIGRRGIPGEKVVTNAKGGDSFHQYGVAADFFPALHGKPIMFEKDGDEISDPIWNRIAIVAKTHGLEWAGLWKSFPEGPHFQYTAGLTINDLRSGVDFT